MNEPAATGAGSHPAIAAGRMGMKLALVSLAIALAAVNTGNNLLYLILSLVLGLAAISSAAASWSLRRLALFPLLPAEVTAGESFLAGAEVRGKFPLLPQTWVRVTVLGLPCPIEIDVPVSGAQGRGIGSTRILAPARGAYENLKITAFTGYPLDLARRRTRATSLSAGLLVLPRFDRATSLHVPAAGAARPGLAANSNEGGRAGVDLHKIREYTGREDARRIDWRSSARARRLMLRDFEREHERRIDIVLDSRADSDVAFEKAVERCAAILDLARRNHHDARLITAASGAPLSGHTGMRHLAVVKRDTGAGAAPHDAIQSLMTRTRAGAERIVISADPSRATPIVLA